MVTYKLADIPKTQSFTRRLPPDSKIPDTETAFKNEKDVIRTPRILHDGSFSYSLPEPRKEYVFLTASDHALRDLGIDPSETTNPDFHRVVSGEIYNDGTDFIDEEYPFPYSQAYAGWQFGQFAGQLGDGRVHNLFEVPKTTDDRNNRNRYELQLKGSGKTPYLRFADGKAVLRSSIREYIISEHLHAIGIPTTRALSLTYLPRTPAMRSSVEKCAIVARFAELWIRIGTFDLYRWRGDRVGARLLADYVIKELFTINAEQFVYLKRLLAAKSDFFTGTNQSLGELTDYDRMYLEIVVRNATTAAYWQSYGFLNGVLNTDNTSVLGLSMDFGPFSIMDKYDPNYTPNSEDHEHRYGYLNTPTAIWWNLTRLGEDLAELIGAGSGLINDDFFVNSGVKNEWEEPIVTRATKLIEVAGEVYKYAFTKKYVETLFSRLGLLASLVDQKDPNTQNVELLEPMLDMLYKVQCDFNKFFLILQRADLDSDNFNPEAIAELVLLPTAGGSKYDQKELTKEIVDWLLIYRKYLRQSELADSGTRKEISGRYNPLFLPRNWILDQVIQYTADSNGEDLSYLKKLEKMSMYPFDKAKWGSELKEVEGTWLLQSDMGDEYSMLQCSCSS